jgi:hypothetical protein
MLEVGTPNLYSDGFFSLISVQICFTTTFNLFSLCHENQRLIYFWLRNKKKKKIPTFLVDVPKDQIYYV